MPISLKKIIGTITGKVAFERTGENFDTIESAFNTLETIVDSKASNSVVAALQTDLDEHKAENANKHIKESGENENGRYIRFDDGTQICMTKYIHEVDVPNREQLPMPAAFAKTNSGAVASISFQPNIIISDNTTTNRIKAVLPSFIITAMEGGTYGGYPGNYWHIRNLEGTETAGDKVECYLLAIGRWK